MNPPSTAYPFHHSVAEVLCNEFKNDLSKHVSFFEVFDCIKRSPSIPDYSAHQYLNQGKKIVQMVAYFASEPFEVAQNKDIAYLYNPVYLGMCPKKLDEYLQNFFIATGYSYSSVIAFLYTFLMIGDIYGYIRKDIYQGALEIFHYDAYHELYVKYDLPVQEKACTQWAILPSKEAVYQRICDTFQPGTLERVLLSLITFIPMRDDFDLFFINTKPTGEDLFHDVDFIAAEHVGKNLFIYFGPTDMFVVLQNTKTIGKGFYKSVTHKLPPECCKECQDFFTMAVGFHAEYPFGKIKRSQDLIRWNYKMGFFLNLRWKSGEEEEKKQRGAGVDFFRRLHRASATNPDELAKVTKALGHSTTTSLKYQGEVDNNIVV